MSSSYSQNRSDDHRTAKAPDRLHQERYGCQLCFKGFWGAPGPVECPYCGYFRVAWLTYAQFAQRDNPRGGRGEAKRAQR